MCFRSSKEKHKEFNRFFQVYYPKVRAFAESILKSEEEAKDVAQEIFLKLWDKTDIWMGRIESCSPYVYSITKNHIFDLIKHKKIERRYQENISTSLLSELDITDPYSEIYAKELHLLISLALKQMPEKRKLVFEMSRFEGKSNNDIALNLGLSVRTVERHIYLALGELKDIIQKAEKDRKT